MLVRFDSEFFHKFGDFGFDFDCHWNDRMVLDVRYFKLFYRYDCSQVRFEQLLVNLKQVILFIKLQIFKKF